MRGIQSKRNLGIVVIVLFLGALIGTLMGEILGLILPEGVVKEFFLRSVAANVGPMTIGVVAFSITLGFSIKLNVISLIGIAVAYYMLRWWR